MGLLVGALGCGRRADDGAALDGALGALCDAELDYFRDEVYRPILGVHCIGCHNADGPAGGSRMVLRLGDDDATVADNLRAVAMVATVTSGDRSLLLTMPTDSDPERKHPGGMLLSPDGLDYRRLQTFVAALTTDGCDAAALDSERCVGGGGGPRLLRRLTPAQYDNSVRALTGLDGDWGTSFPADPRTDGFDNSATELVVSPLFADKLQAAAEDVAARVELSSLLDCELAAGDDACAERFIRNFGRAAFRRPLSDDDAARYLALHAVAGGFEAGLRLVVTGMLQSPHFLYRFEIGDDVGGATYALSDHEIAAELSFLVLDGPPDGPLAAAADAGEVHTPAQILAHAERLLEAPGARAMVTDFATQWLGLDRLPTVPKDAGRFPELTSDVRQAMGDEAARFVQGVVFDGSGALPELLTASLPVPGSPLAEFYGAAAAESAGAALAGRSGVLTLGGVMLTHARSNDSSPIHRGKLVRERLLCQVPPPPPPGINAQPPPLDPALTARERYAAHSAQEPCHSCHRLMDPIGFAFEHFDGVGRYRETDNGNPIDASGEVLSTAQSDAAFEGTDELAALLAASPDVHACFALQWFRFAHGLDETGDTACAVDALREEFTAGGLSVRALVLASAGGLHFRERRGASTPGDGGDDGGGGGVGDGDGDGDGDTGNPGDGDGDPGSAGDGGDGEGDGGLVGQGLALVQDDSWDTGYCHTYEVTNTSNADLVWSVSLVVEGSVNHGWEADIAGSTGTVVFTGLAHNATLAPGASTRFGFCADL